MSSLQDRIAAAPISWGVSEVPGWGHQMAPERVCGEIRSLGLHAAELGPEGYLTKDEVAGEISASGFSIIAGFIPIVFRLSGGLVDSLADLEQTFARLRDVGARLGVLAVVGDGTGYDSRPRLRGTQWQEVADALDVVLEVARANQMRAVLHPHFGTFIESTEDTLQVLERSEIGVCLDTGHLALAGADPVGLASVAPRRIQHVHLKDIDDDLASRVRRRQISYSDAVRQGLFRPLGQGQAKIEEVVTHLESSGYGGWYVLEQDVALAEEPPPGSGPLLSVRSSLDYLTGLLKKLGNVGSPSAELCHDPRGGAA